MIGRVTRSPRICRNRLWFSPVETSICGQAAAGLIASYASPRLVDNFLGGLSRRDPVGGSANGIPANFSTLPLASPTTVLDGERTTVGETARPSTTGEEPWRAGRARTLAAREAQAEMESAFMLLWVDPQEELQEANNRGRWSQAGARDKFTKARLAVLQPGAIVENREAKLPILSTRLLIGLASPRRRVVSPHMRTVIIAV